MLHWQCAYGHCATQMPPTVYCWSLPPWSTYYKMDCAHGRAPGARLSESRCCCCAPLSGPLHPGISVLFEGGGEGEGPGGRRLPGGHRADRRAAGLRPLALVKPDQDDRHVVTGVLAVPATGGALILYIGANPPPPTPS